MKLAVKEQARKEAIKYELQSGKDYRINIDRIVDNRSDAEIYNLRKIEDAKNKVRSLLKTSTYSKGEPEYDHIFNEPRILSRNFDTFSAQKI